MVSPYSRRKLKFEFTTEERLEVENTVAPYSIVRDKDLNEHFISMFGKWVTLMKPEEIVKWKINW